MKATRAERLTGALRRQAKAMVDAATRYEAEISARSDVEVPLMFLTGSNSPDLAALSSALLTVNRLEAALSVMKRGADG